ncbi:MAG: DJ-1/PfpI/YhbO family deglycase/protease [Candidatus Aegiribacteria sp.]|nr:DJ-1/PfpI/YhbO family deglycase/protease [Candidatus Aegiribacteria sp.]
MASKIAVLVDDMFEDVEYTSPVDAFQNAGHETVNLGLNEGATVSGKKKGTEVVIDRTVKNLSIDDFDALLIPGGYSPDRLRAHEAPVDFVRDFMESGKPVFVICHGPQLLITADVLRDRKVTGWRSISMDIKNAGADYRDEEVVEDGNLVSSRQPSDLPAFIKASLKKLD